MTVKEYIQGKIGGFNVNLNASAIFDILALAKIEPETEMTDKYFDAVNIGIIRYIPVMLAGPQSVSESGFSISWNTEGLKNLYNMGCRMYKIPNELNPKVTFL